MKKIPKYYWHTLTVILYLVGCNAGAAQKPLPASQIIEKITPSPAAPPSPPTKSLAEKLAQAIPKLATLASTASLDVSLMGKKYVIVGYTTAEDNICQETSSNEGDQISFLRVALLSEEPTELRLIAKTERLEQYGPRDGVRYKTNKDTLEIIHTNTNSNVAAQTEIWKFKLKYGSFQLIGYDELSVQETTDDLFYEVGKSINFTTMQVIDWRKLGKDKTEWDDSKPWHTPFRVKSTIKYKEFPRRLNGEKQFRLDGFNFKNWEQWEHRHACGWVEDTFTYWDCTKVKTERHISEEFSCGPPYQPLR